MNFFNRRQVGTCPKGQNYYQCYTGSYAGCCSHDPCAYGGVCDNTLDNTNCGAQGNSDTKTITLLGGTVTSTLITGDPSQWTHTIAPAPVPDASETPASTDESSDAPNESGNSEVSSSPSSQVDVVPLVSTSVSETSTTISIPETASITALSTSQSNPTNTTHTSKSKSTHSATSSPSLSNAPPTRVLAGSIIGSIAGLALLAFLLLLCCKRKHKSKFSFSFKRKAKEEKEREKALAEAEKIMIQREEALRKLESRRSPVATGFDFGQGQDSIPATPKKARWI